MQRKIEAAGFTTISLSNIPDLTAAVGAPRVAAIEYPFGRTLGYPGDVDGQMAVLEATLAALTEMDQPGQIRHLPFEWKEPPAEDDHPSHSAPPIVDYLIKHLWDIPKFINRQPPEPYRVY